MVNDVERLEEEIAGLETKLAEARERRKKLEALDPEKRFATLLHSKYCRYSHLDQCGWGYEVGEKDTWSRYAHRKWLKEAQELLSFFDQPS